MATIKQKRAVREIAENGRSVSAAMRAAGYSPKSATRPKHLTDSIGFKELMNEIAPDTEVGELIKQGLYAKKVITSHTEPDYEYPDHANRYKFIEMVLKLKGYLKDQPNNNTVIIPIYAGLSSEPDKVPLPRYDSDQEDIQTQETN